MARKPRLYFPGAFYHLLNRGNQRQPIFHDEQDYQTLIAALAATSARYPLRIHAYCLMPNHFHLLGEVDLFPASQVMRSLQTSYARYYNHRYQKVGHVFQGRYRAILCDKGSYLLALARYLHLNPVRAKLVSCPEDWLWSSHRAYVGLSKNDWLYQGDILSGFGTKGAGGLVEFLSETKDLGRHPEYYQPERYPVLASPEYAARIPHRQEPSRRKTTLVVPGGRMSLKRISEILAQGGGLETEHLAGRGGPRALSRLREEICFAATHFFHFPAIQLAQWLQLSPSAITRILRRAQHRFMAEPSQLERITGLLLAG